MKDMNQWLYRLLSLSFFSLRSVAEAKKPNPALSAPLKAQCCPVASLPKEHNPMKKTLPLLCALLL